MKKSERLVIIGLIFALALGGGYAVFNRIGQALTDGDIRLLVGGCGVLAIVLAVGVMFIAWSASQSRLRRQELQQDDLDELKKMAMILKMSGGRTPNITVKTPETSQLTGPMVWPYPVSQPGPGQSSVIDGDYRDAIDLE